MVPLSETDELVHKDAPIVATRAWAKTGAESHTGPGEFSMACLKVHRSVVEAIEPPWFAFEYTDDGAAQTSCECGYFARKARAAGFECVHAGKIGHRITVTVVPGENGPEMIFDPAMARINKQFLSRNKP